jgi:hypothetical protein
MDMEMSEHLTPVLKYDRIIAQHYLIKHSCCEEISGGN